MDVQNFLNIFLEREVLKNLKEGHDVLIKASKYRTEWLVSGDSNPEIKGHKVNG